MREEEDFEDVGLNDDPKPAQQTAPPKKRGFLSRLTDSSNEQQAAPGATPSQESKWHFGGRKRGQSGQGAELGSMPQPSRENTPKPVAPESGLRHSETPRRGKGFSVVVFFFFACNRRQWTRDIRELLGPSMQDLSATTLLLFCMSCRRLKVDCAGRSQSEWHTDYG
jgi:hypothetical protein